jgi:hypothetical protein
MQGWGTSTVDFGAFPGSSNTSLAVTGQDAIAADATVTAYIYPTATADHTADEHLVDSPIVFAGTVIAGTGFTLYAVRDPIPLPPPDYTVFLAAEKLRLSNSSPITIPRPYGLWTVAWVWRNSI